MKRILPLFPSARPTPPPRPVKTHANPTTTAFTSDSGIAEPLVSKPLFPLSYFYDSFVVLAYFSVYSVW